jgi:uncharacterized membrane protein
VTLRVELIQADWRLAEKEGDEAQEATEGQIIAILNEHEGRVERAELCRKLGSVSSIHFL